MVLMKRISRVLILATVIAIGGLVRVHAQDSPRASMEFLPMFYFDAISYAGDQGKSRVDFYVQVPYEEIRFVKESDAYVARYDVSLTVTNEETDQSLSRSWSMDVRATEFDKTVSHKLYSLTHQSIEVEPGNYLLAVSVKDQETKKEGKTTRALLVSNYEKDSVSLSDIMIASQMVHTQDGMNKIVPNVTGMIESGKESLNLYIEVYDSGAPEKILLASRIFDKSRNVVHQSLHEQRLANPRTSSFIRIDSLSLPVGTYLVTIQAQRAGKETTAVATTSRSVFVRWTDIPFSITDLRKAVEQIRYLAQPTEYDYITSAANDEELRSRFLEFWKKRDPDQSTVRNELMEEYYKRIEYANKHYSHFIEGWRTDMGMVFIRFGPADNVERHPFDGNSKPYEVWYYYNIERQFIFVDESGFGDYRLRYPTTDIWGRIR